MLAGGCTDTMAVKVCLGFGLCVERERVLGLSLCERASTQKGLSGIPCCIRTTSTQAESRFCNHWSDRLSFPAYAIHTAMKIIEEVVVGAVPSSSK